MKPEKTCKSAIDVIRQYADSEQAKLPVFPGVAFELQQLLADDNTSIDAVSNVISKDQALASEVLRLANSAYFSGPRKVATIREASMRLGLNHVFNLVICTCQRSLYKSADAALNKYLNIAWKHALCVAIGSKWLVGELGYRELLDEAFLAGLLHDIGKLVLIKAFEVMSSKNEGLKLPEAFVSRALVTMHAEQGYKLMDEWSIPSIYCAIALDHHREDFDKEDVLMMSVRIVNQACRKEGMSTSPEPRADLVLLPEVCALDIGDDVLNELESVIARSITSEFSGKDL